jgi:hypothetical protein
MLPRCSPELRPSCATEKEGVDIKDLNKNGISMKRFSIIAINQLQGVKPTMRIRK